MGDGLEVFLEFPIVHQVPSFVLAIILPARIADCVRLRPRGHTSNARHTRKVKRCPIAGRCPQSADSTSALGATSDSEEHLPTIFSWPTGTRVNPGNT